MTNFEIKSQLQSLQEEFIKVLNDTNNTFELNPRVVELQRQMNDAAAQCSHTNEDGTSAVEDGVCLYCGRRFD